MRIQTSIAAAVLILAAFPGVLAAQPLASTEFTFQGQLKEGDVPVDGPADFVFRLFDDASGGSQIGTYVALASVDVDRGLFTVRLDFGAEVFNGQARWMGIEVRVPATNGVWTQLSPRHPVTATPYALQTRGLFCDSGGQVGIGTDAPTSALQVGDIGNYFWGLADGWGDFSLNNGEVGFSIGVATGGSGKGDVYMWPTGGTERIFLANPTDGKIVTIDNGKVGIGTSTPDARLEIEYDSSTANPHLLLTEADQGYARIALATMGNDRRWTIAGTAEDVPPDGFPGDDLNFYHSVAGNILNLSYDGTVGHVGIGTTAPQVRLHVRGGSDTSLSGGGYLVLGSTAGPNISIDNNEIMARNNGEKSTLFLNNEGGIVRVPVLEITGADVAERFPVSEEGKPGMVMEIDPDHPGQLRVARGAYNRRVAGVVSGAKDLPVGAVLGNLPGSEDEPPIALSGRVWVHCDATYHKIEPGDLLTTSGIPGHAMKVINHERAQGAIVGKAMTSLHEGQGLVLVLVSLQ